jgi:hypothetical protein
VRYLRAIEFEEVVMLAGSPVLKNHANHIAGTVAEFCDVPTLVPQIAELVTRIAENLDSPRRTPPDLQPLLDAGLSESVIARVLRGVLFESIEMLRSEVDSTILGASVVALRACLHRLIPRTTADPEDREFYRRLMKNERDGLSPLHAQLQSLFSDIRFTRNSRACSPISR